MEKKVTEKNTILMNQAFSEKIKVLFFISSLAIGGAERVMVDILSHIDKSKIEPILVLLHPYENLPFKQYLTHDIKVIVVNRRSDSSFNMVKQFVAFMKVVYREKPRVILSMLTHNNVMAILSGMLFRIKVIACEHSVLGEVIKTKEGGKILWFPVAPLVKVFYRFADRVIAVSEGIKANLSGEFNISEHKILVFHNPLDLTRIAKLKNTTPEHPLLNHDIPIVIAIGRLVSLKGFDTLIKAFSHVVPEIAARLIIMGEGPERESLEKLVESLGLTDKVFFIGFQKNPYSFLACSDVFVLSSNFEGLPVVILEAMACGVPVISTECKSGPAEILDGGRYGLLVPVGDADALARSIEKLLKDGALREKLSYLGKERIKDFSADKIVKQYEKVIYDSVSTKT